MRRVLILGGSVALALAAATVGAGPPPWQVPYGPTRLEWLAMELTAQSGGNACSDAECTTIDFMAPHTGSELVVTIAAAKGVRADRAFAARQAERPLFSVVNGSSTILGTPPIVNVFVTGNGSVTHYRCDLAAFAAAEKRLDPKFDAACLLKQR